MKSANEFIRHTFQILTSCEICKVETNELNIVLNGFENIPQHIQEICDECMTAKLFEIETVGA